MNPLRALARGLRAVIQKETAEIDTALVRQSEQISNLTRILMDLAQFIKEQTAIEREQGQVLLDKIEALQTALDNSETLTEEIKAAAASVPGLKDSIASLEKQLADATEAAQAIADINPTPVSDAVVDTVVTDPEIPTPPIVEQAPAVEPSVIQDTPVVDAAIDALDNA